jgi:hypothetical protein
LRFALLLLLPGILGAQILFSRRVYAEHGRTYQQIWEWSASDGSVKALTRSPRNHLNPIPSRDGRRIFFLASRWGAWRDEAYGVWSFDRATGIERQIFAGAFDLLGTAKDGALIVSTLEGGTLLRLGSKSVRISDKAGGGSVSPDGTRLAFSPLDGDVPIDELFVVDAVTGGSKQLMGACHSASWSPDSSRIACTAGEEIVVLDAAAGHEIERIHFPGRAMPPGAEYPMTTPDFSSWSPDGKSLLVGTVGEESGSSEAQSDYFVFDFATKHWTRAGSGNDATWAGRNSIMFTTPMDLVPLGKRRTVWVEYLALFDLNTGRKTILASGAMRDVEPVAIRRTD